jgi:hypothetical protein
VKALVQDVKTRWNSTFDMTGLWLFRKPSRKFWKMMNGKTKYLLSLAIMLEELSSSAIMTGKLWSELLRCLALSRRLPSSYQQHQHAYPRQFLLSLVSFTL